MSAPVPAAVPAPRGRRRDPARRQRILDAAAELVAQRGFHGVRLAEIGAAADIVGSGIYRHFDSKADVLVSLLDEVIDTLLLGARAAVDTADGAAAALDRLVDGHVTFALEQRRLLQVYHQEFPNLPDADRTRLQRKQRRYLEIWAGVLSEVRPDLGDDVARVLVRAAIGAIHSILFFSSRLPVDRLRETLAATAHGCLQVAETPAARSVDEATVGD